MTKTKAIIDTLKISYHLLETSFDIDNIDDLKTLKKFIEHNPRPFTKMWFDERLT